MGPDENLNHRAELLLHQVHSLVRAVDAVAKQTRLQRLLLIITGVGLVLDLALSGLFVAQHFSQVHTNNRVLCQNELRSETAKIADRDRVNIDHFFAAVIDVKTAAQFRDAYGKYKAVRDADDAARAALGSGKSSTCG